MHIEVIVTFSGDQLEPDVKMSRFRVEVKVRGAVGELCAGAAHPSHSVQRLELRHFQQGIAELVDFVR